MNVLTFHLKKTHYFVCEIRLSDLGHLNPDDRKLGPRVLLHLLPFLLIKPGSPLFGHFHPDITVPFTSGSLGPFNITCPAAVTLPNPEPESASLCISSPLASVEESHELTAGPGGYRF